MIQFSSTITGDFSVFCVFDQDTVLDHFVLSMDELLEKERCMQTEWTPHLKLAEDTSIDADSKGEEHRRFADNSSSACKTIFSVPNLIRLLEQLTMQQVMLSVSMD